jgi:hypothetical protein
MTGEDSDPEELNDGFSLDGAVGLDHITMGAESTEELGVATVRVIPKEGPYQEFDSVMVCELAGEATVIAKEAIRGPAGDAHPIPSTIWQYADIEALVIPMDDGRLEAAEAERIGVNADGQ